MDEQTRSTEPNPAVRVNLSVGLARQAAVAGEKEAGTLDFNDGVVVEDARLNGWKILTEKGR